MPMLSCIFGNRCIPRAKSGKELCAYCKNRSFRDLTTRAAMSPTKEEREAAEPLIANLFSALNLHRDVLAANGNQSFLCATKDIDYSQESWRPLHICVDAAPCTTNAYKAQLCPRCNGIGKGVRNKQRWRAYFDSDGRRLYPCAWQNPKFPETAIWKMGPSEHVGGESIWRAPHMHKCRAVLQENQLCLPCVYRMKGEEGWEGYFDGDTGVMEVDPLM
ncbi:hypothetical protein GQ44DRAFT_756285 [Phaeosphaeriaceae sp. PMI808]|nr:hypothetical protein GQ44DRAFT_756285 [Phaeosphaeriaceae sp. PMI808]